MFRVIFYGIFTFILSNVMSINSTPFSLSLSLYFVYQISLKTVDYQCIFFVLELNPFACTSESICFMGRRFISKGNTKIWEQYENNMETI